MSSALDQVAELVRLESGISLRSNQRRALETAIRRAAPGAGPAEFLEQAAEPLGGRALVQRLLDEITIQETAFLRHRDELEAIDWHALLASAQGLGNDPIRVWVAGCATGEEAYTIVLLAREAFGGDAPVDVLATDISERALDQAREGSYRPRSITRVDERLLDAYFVKDGRRLSVVDALRRPVRFQRHNLVHDPVPPLGEERFGLILCRNVLIYFDAPTVDRVIDGLERALRPEGMLVLGAADALSGATRRLADATTPRRQDAPSRPPRRPPDELLAEALRAADAGRRREALEKTESLLREDPLNAGAYFVRGLVELEAGAGAGAVDSLRRALYIDPAFSVAAFTLGRAYDELAESDAARRAYEQALRVLDPADDRHEPLLRQVDVGDIAAACRTRLAALRS